MSESMLDWMHRFQRKNSVSKSDDLPHPIDSEGYSNDYILQSNNALPLKQMEDKIPQTTLDNFVKKTEKSLIYDDHFGIEDLRLLTRRWREQNLLVE